MKPLPDAIRELMKLRGFETQTQLAAAADLSTGTVSYWLSGDRGREINEQTIDTLSKLSGALNVSLEHWFEYRLYQMGRAFQRHPDLEKQTYAQVMKLAADYDELTEQQPEAGGTGENGSTSKRTRAKSRRNPK